MTLANDRSSSDNHKQPHTVKGLLKQLHGYESIAQQEEYELISSWQQRQDPEALDRIVRSHSKLVKKIAHGYRGYGLPLPDLISEGYIGIMQAIKKFDMTKGFRFSTYARWWIKALMNEYILNSWSIVKISNNNAQRKLFYQLHRLKQKMGIGTNTSLTEHEAQHIAETLSVSRQNVFEMNQRLVAGDYSLNQRVGSQDDEHLEWQDWLTDDKDYALEYLHQNELKHHHQVLNEALKSLKPRENLIIKYRRLTEPPKTLDELASQFNISRERVRQIEAAAFIKLQKMVKQNVNYHE